MFIFYSDFLYNKSEIENAFITARKRDDYSKKKRNPTIFNRTKAIVVAISPRDTVRTLFIRISPFPIVHIEAHAYDLYLRGQAHRGRCNPIKKRKKPIVSNTVNVAVSYYNNVDLYEIRGTFENMTARKSCISDYVKRVFE